MRRITFTIAVVFLAVSAVTVQAQETGAVSSVSIPVAVRSQADCTGFIASPSVPRDLFVVGGADDDFHSVVRQFVAGESIFISQHKGGEIAVGAEYSVVRPANELFHTMHYQGERWGIRKLGKPYEDVAKVMVTRVNPKGAVAKVTFSCGSIVPGDTLVPFQPRLIPQYTVSKPLDHFAPLDQNKQHGRITGSHNNFGYLGQGTVVYLNLGEREGALPGQRFRIYKVLSRHTTGFLTSQPTPPEIIGEAVVLSVQGKSCAAMVVSSYREISAGDYVEKE
ncbi:MAG TPA: hypothetical protein VKO18_06910 [Terriglobia bacterium]|nr:hypothetical protein [Terriglobia bacterium]